MRDNQPTIAPAPPSQKPRRRWRWHQTIIRRLRRWWGRYRAKKQRWFKPFALLVSAAISGWQRCRSQPSQQRHAIPIDDDSTADQRLPAPDLEEVKKLSLPEIHDVTAEVCFGPWPEGPRRSPRLLSGWQVALPTPPPPVGLAGTLKLPWRGPQPAAPPRQTTTEPGRACYLPGPRRCSPGMTVRWHAGSQPLARPAWPTRPLVTAHLIPLSTAYFPTCSPTLPHFTYSTAPSRAVRTRWWQPRCPERWQPMLLITPLSPGSIAQLARLLGLDVGLAAGSAKSAEVIEDGVPPAGDQQDENRKPAVRPSGFGERSDLFVVKSPDQRTRRTRKRPAGDSLVMLLPAKRVRFNTEGTTAAHLALPLSGLGVPECHNAMPGLTASASSLEVVEPTRTGKTASADEVASLGQPEATGVSDDVLPLRTGSGGSQQDGNRAPADAMPPAMRPSGFGKQRQNPPVIKSLNQRTRKRPASDSLVVLLPAKRVRFNTEGTAVAHLTPLLSGDSRIPECHNAVPGLAAGARPLKVVETTGTEQTAGTTNGAAFLRQPEAMGVSDSAVTTARWWWSTGWRRGTY